MKARPSRRSGNLPALKVELWAAIRAASQMIADPQTSPEMRLRSISALSTAAAVYAKVLYDHDIERRLEALEEDE